MKADPEGQTTSPSPPDVLSSVPRVASAPTGRHLSSRESHRGLEDALPLKERAACVEQQRCSFAGLEKQQAERVVAPEEQLAAEKLRLQKTRLNIQQAQQEAERIALLMAAQTAADELKGRFGRPPSLRRVHGRRARDSRHRTHHAKFREPFTR